MSKPNTHSALSAMNALDLALRSQELEADAAAVMRRLLPLFDRIEGICRDFDQLSPEAREARRESVAALAEIADAVAKESGLERFSGLGARVDGSLHEVVDARPLDGARGETHGQVVELREAGWLHHGRLLRRAKIVAASHG